jgi:hypothetical protein
VLHDPGYGHDPNQDFKKPDYGRQALEPLGHEDNAQCVQGHIADAQTKDQQRHRQVIEVRRMRQRHGKKGREG